MDNLKDVMLNKVSRRKFISGVSAGMGAAAAVSFAAGCGGSSTTTVTSTPTTTPTTAPTTSSASSGVTDVDILNFALNLEYLEASYYLIGTTGAGLSTTDMGTGTGLGSVTGGTQVQFKTTAIQQYANEIAQDELAHVQFLRAAITAAGSTPVPMPNIDLMTSFNAAAAAAMIPGGTFNPFDNENDFILGAFIFEDVGVTAYHGAAGLITSSANLAAAGGIYATEAYHAGIVRTILLELGGAYVTNANLISNLRGQASMAATSQLSTTAETPLSFGSVTASAAPNSLAFARNTDQVLHIVYLNAQAGVVQSGGFFPSGLNGMIAKSAS